jgi:hypothetical protein
MRLELISFLYTPSVLKFELKKEFLFFYRLKQW